MNQYEMYHLRLTDKFRHFTKMQTLMPECEDLEYPISSLVFFVAVIQSILPLNFRYNTDYFDITTSIFLKRLANPLIFWNDKFFEINDGKPEQYGALWLIITLAIILGLASNMNKFFI